MTTWKILESTMRNTMMVTLHFIFIFKMMPLLCRSKNTSKTGPFGLQTTTHIPTFNDCRNTKSRIEKSSYKSRNRLTLCNAITPLKQKPLTLAELVCTDRMQAGDAPLEISYVIGTEFRRDVACLHNTVTIIIKFEHFTFYQIYFNECYSQIYGFLLCL